VARELKAVIAPEEKQLIEKIPTADLDAYENYLRGNYYLYRLGKEDLEKALEYFNCAIELDPGWAPPYSGVAVVYQGLMQMGFISPDEAMIEINKSLNQALELDPDFPGSHYTKAILSVWMEWDWEKGESEFLKALEINPNDVMSRIYYSHLLGILKRFGEASFHSQMAAELDPMNPLVLALSAMVDYMGYEVRVEQALEKSKKALEIDPGHYLASVAFESSSFLIGDYKNSIETFTKIRPEIDNETRQIILNVFRDKGYHTAIDSMLIYLEEYAKTNYIGNTDLGDYYNRAGDMEKAIECYIKAYKLHDPMTPYLVLPAYGFDKIKDDPRIISMVESMNLPITKSE